MIMVVPGRGQMGLEALTLPEGPEKAKYRGACLPTLPAFILLFLSLNWLLGGDVWMIIMLDEVDLSLHADGVVKFCGI